MLFKSRIHAGTPCDKGCNGKRSITLWCATNRQHHKTKTPRWQKHQGRGAAPDTACSTDMRLCSKYVVLKEIKKKLMQEVITWNKVGMCLLDVVTSLPAGGGVPSSTLTPLRLNKLPGHLYWESVRSNSPLVISSH